MRKDPARLAELHRQMILDSAPEQAFDDLSRLLASGLEVPVAIVNMLDDDRDWFKSSVGLPNSESPASTSLCQVFFDSSNELVVVEDTLLDPRFANHPKVVGEPFVRFYAAARLTSHGLTLGTLCAYDLRPRKITPEQIEHLRLLSTAAIELIEQRTVQGD
jgi:GAF domain-containing protein